MVLMAVVGHVAGGGIPLWLLVVALAASVVLIHVLGRRVWSSSRRVLRGADRGTAELELCLVSPVLLTIVLFTIQFALLLNAAIVVEHAAFNAGRSVTVWIGAALDDEASGRVAGSNSSESGKLLRAQRAAALACTPISPRLTSALGIPAAGAAMSQLADLIVDSGLAGGGSGGGRELGWLLKLGPDQWLSASQLTEVRLLQPDSSLPIAPGAALEIEVEHRYCVGVLFAGPLLARACGGRPEPLFSSTGWSIPIRARAIVVNQGGVDGP